MKRRVMKRGYQMEELIKVLREKNPSLAARVIVVLDTETVIARVTDRVLRLEIGRVLKKADKLRASAMKLKTLLKERTVSAGSSDPLVNLERKVDKLAVMLPGLVHDLRAAKI